MSIYLWNERKKEYIEMFFIVEPECILLDLPGIATCFTYMHSGCTHIRKCKSIERIQYDNDCLVIRG